MIDIQKGRHLNRIESDLIHCIIASHVSYIWICVTLINLVRPQIYTVMNGRMHNTHEKSNHHIDTSERDVIYLID